MSPANTVADDVEPRARIRQHFQKYPDDKYGEGWAELWNNGSFLPWDHGCSHPALVETIKERKDILGDVMIRDGGVVRRKRALVPGCGRGFDVLLLKSFGFDAVGLEYSKAAVEACHKYHEEHHGEYLVQDESSGEGTSLFVVGDFFKDDWRGGRTGADEKFDLIYDHTFFCALDPSLRPRWARRMSELLGPAPHSNLICLEFPTYKPPSTGGPPFASPCEAYLAHLTHPGEDIPYDEHGYVKTTALAGRTKHALKQIAHWKPKRSHENEKDQDGDVRDWVSIWRHQ